jgi:hypothetical protein
MKTAIIGLGNIGRRVAENLAHGGESMIVASRNLADAQALAAKLGSNAEAMTAADAVRVADVVVLAIMFEPLKDFIAAHQRDLAGKIIVDPSNAIAHAEKGGFEKTIPANQSAAQVIAALLPPGAKLVKAFGSLAAQALTTGTNRTPERAVLFYAADDAKAGRAVAHLITVSGFDPVNAGGLDQAIRIEAFGDLHEVGKLGRLVSAKEAKAAL